jgi:MFS transporter, MHS family, proline/betaine transporter
MSIEKHLKKLITAVTIGGILEWYEIFLYVYWAPQISQLFFAKSYGDVALIDALLIFAFGFVARPIGGLLFGYIGDRYGRKKAFLASIIFCTLPTMVIAFLPTYASIGIISQVILSFTRFLQGIPAGGELPGAMCYLKETAPEKKKFFITSFAFIGAQLGGVLGILECLIFEKYMPTESLLEFGWRISFALGGLIGLLGFYLRHSIQETPMFLKIERHDHILKKPIKESFFHHTRPMVIAFFISIFEVIGYFMVAVFPALFYGQVFEISSTQNLLMTVVLLTFSALSIPLFGRLGDVVSTKKLMVIGSLFTLLLTFPLYVSISNGNFFWTIVIQCLLILSLNVQFALLPGILSDLFPTSVRFSCLGFSFNLCDSLIGGLTPVMALCCVGYTHNPGSFVGLLTIAAILNIWLFTGARAKAIFQKKFHLFFRCVDQVGSK